MSLFFITGNQGKFAEVKNVLPDVEQIEIDLDEIQELDPHKIVEHKLEQARKYFKNQPGIKRQSNRQSAHYLIEDTSLYIDELGGLPGPLIKWFLKALTPAGLAKIVAKLSTNTAVAKTIVGYSDGRGQVHFFTGEVRGVIVPPRGDHGFGWDSIFQPSNQPNGEIKTFGQMTLAEKERFSMRKLALLQLKKFLEKRTGQ